MRFRLRRREGSEEVCLYCRDGVAPAERWVCAGCGGVQHVACAEELGACPTLGCGGAVAATGAPPRRRRRRRRRRRGRQRRRQGQAVRPVAATREEGAPAAPRSWRHWLGGAAITGAAGLWLALGIAFVVVNVQGRIDGTPEGYAAANEANWIIRNWLKPAAKGLCAASAIGPLLWWFVASLAERRRHR